MVSLLACFVLRLLLGLSWRWGLVQGKCHINVQFCLVIQLMLQQKSRVHEVGSLFICSCGWHVAGMALMILNLKICLGCCCLVFSGLSVSSFSDWKKHGTDYFQCNRYKPTTLEEKQRKQQAEAVKRYFFYFERVGGAKLAGTSTSPRFSGRSTFHFQLVFPWFVLSCL